MSRWRAAFACITSGMLGCASGEPLAESPDPPAADHAAVLQGYKRTAAEQIAAALGDPAVRGQVLDQLRQRGPVALADLPALGVGPAELGDDAVPELWLREPPGGGDSAGLVIAYAPDGSERSWSQVPAYALGGAPLTLDAQHAPGVPVVVLETHGRLAMHKAIGLANVALQRAGLQRPAGKLAPLAATAGRWTTRLDSIRLSDDEEPWISGSAEIYAVVSGVVGNNDPQVRIVDMPYLDNDGTTYAPRQILVDWTDYAFQAVNIQLFEHDDNTSYQQLVTVLLSAVGAAGSLAGVPMIQAVTEIANRIIEALPTSVFTNDDDYVDTFYTVEETVTYTNLAGAGRNATASFTPFFLQSN